MTDGAVPRSISRFSGLADVYDRYRPRYPAEATAAILAGLPERPTVIDIGAGTGISTRALCDAGARAIAIEPNDDMRTFAKASGVDARKGTATATGLPDNTADAVASFQAFHWFATEASLAEFARVLRPRGRVALVWNYRDESDPLMAELRDVESAAGEAAMIAGLEFSPRTLEALLRGSRFGGLRRLQFDNAQTFDKTGLVGRVRSNSYVPRSGPVLEKMLASIDALHGRFADPLGNVTLHYRTEVVIGDLGA